MEEKRGDERNRKRDLAYQYTQDTTFHGVRFITEDASPVARRLLWLLIVLSCVAGFTYIIVTRIQYWNTRPKAVNVDIIYATNLDFPAVTICNQNFFKKSQTFYSGHYDDVERRYRKGISNSDDISHDADNCHEHYEREEGVIYVTSIDPVISLEDATDSTLRYLGILQRFNQISLRVCQQICAQDLDALCNSVIYNTSSLTCYVSQAVREPTSYNSQENVVISSAVDTYLRRRCNGIEGIRCNFEDGSNCPLYTEDGLSNTEWEIATGSSSSSSTGPTRDHTLGHGNYYLLDSSKHQRSTFYTSYIDPRGEDLCLQFFYSNKAEGKPATIFVYGSTPRRQSNMYLWITSDETKLEWEELFLFLGDRIQRIEVEVLTVHDQSDVAIDDLSIAPCHSFREQCLRDSLGISYMGNVSRSMSGQDCDPWDRHTNTRGYFPDGSSAWSSGNFCRNPTRDSGGPWCYVRNTTGSNREAYKESCNISYCECRRDELRCTDGLCIKRNYFCDGRSDCPDGSDETKEACNKDIKCTFEAINLCGYEQQPLRAAMGAVGWVRYRGQMKNGDLSKDQNTGSENGYYLYLDSGSTLLDPYQRVTILTIPFTPAPMGDRSYTLEMYVYTGWNNLFPEAAGRIRIYLYLGQRYRLPIGEIVGTDMQEWVRHTFRIPKAPLNGPVPLYYRIGLEGILGGNYLSDMAIDNVDFYISQGIKPSDKACRHGESPCDTVSVCIPTNQLCDGIPQCPDFSDEYHTNCGAQVSVACEFLDSYNCGYIDESDPVINLWEKEGNYMKTSDSKMGKYSLKRLVSPWQPVYTATEHQCLSFNYYMSSKQGFCGIYIYQEQDSARYHLYTLGDHGDSGSIVQRRAHTSLQNHFLTRLVFEVNCTSDTSWSDITAAVGNIELDDTVTCEDKFAGGKFFCKFLSEGDCKYLDVSTSGANWLFTSVGWSLVAKLQPRLRPNAVATILSPRFNLTTEACIGLVFFTHLGYLLDELTITDGDTEVQHTESPMSRSSLGSHIRHIELLPGQHRLKLRIVIENYLDLRLGNDDEMQLNLVEVVYQNDGICVRSDCSFWCDGDVEMCIDSASVCDGIANCPHGEDERDCQTPAVVVCGKSNNEDPCKIDRTTDAELGNLVTTPSAIIRSSDKPSTTVSAGWPAIPRPSENLTEFYWRAGHHISKMLHRCTISGTKCSTKDFSTSITDYGLCHTFNAARGIKSNYTGASHGLQLILNIEQYEYMDGPQTDAGIKVFVSDQKEVPFVRDLGFAVSPGKHALVGMTLSETRRLAQPWGDCGNRGLAYTHGLANYTYSACIRECETNTSVEACNCREAFMPGHSEFDPPICTVSEFLNCWSSQNSSHKTTCGCTEPCERRIFENDLSYATLSSLSVNQILTSEVDQLSTDREEALDISYRTNPQLYRKLLQDWENIAKNYDQFISLSKENAWGPVSSIVMTEKALQRFTNILDEDINKVLGLRLKRVLQAYGSTFEPVRRSYIITAQDMMVDLQMLIFNYQTVMSNRTSRDRKWIKDQLAKSVSLVETFSTAVEQYLHLLEPDSLAFLSNLLPGIVDDLPKTHFLDDRCQDDIEILHKEVVSSTGTMKELDQSLGEANPSTNVSAIVQKLQNSILLLKTQLLPRSTQCVNEYYHALQDTQTWEAGMLSEVRSLSWIHGPQDVDNMLSFNKATADLNTFARFVRESIKEFQSGDNTAKQMVVDLDEKRLTRSKRHLRTFQNNIESEILDGSKKKVHEIQSLSSKVYTKLIHLDHKLSQYLANPGMALSNITLLKWPRPHKQDLSSITMQTIPTRIVNDKVFAELRGPVLVTKLVSWYIEPLEKALTELRADIYKRVDEIEGQISSAIEWNQGVMQSLKFDEEFVTSNFIALDIYYAQLKYQSVEQIKAYDAGSFFSDVGGFMGLLLGGSLITLIEICDLFLYGMCPCSRRRVKKTTSSELQNHLSPQLSAGFLENGEGGVLNAKPEQSLTETNG